MYYNEEAKAEFITDYMRSRIVAFSSLSAIFNKTAELEFKYKKDCSKFEQKEILEMYKGFGAKSVSVLENYNVYLKSYTAYSIYKGYVDNVNAYELINKDMIKECVDPEIQNKIYVTRKQLDDIENELFNFTDKAIIEALWHGISGKSMRDLVSLNRNMFSEDKSSLIFQDGRVIPISKKFSEYLDKAFDETEYLCYGSTIKVDQLKGKDYLYKERNNAYTQPSDDKYFRWVYRKIQNYRNQLGMPELTMKNIQASGLLDKLLKGMKKNNYSMREFLSTVKGKEIAMQYGYKESYYIDVICDKFEGYKG